MNKGEMLFGYPLGLERSLDQSQPIFGPLVAVFAQLRKRNQHPRTPPGSFMAAYETGQRSAPG